MNRVSVIEESGAADDLVLSQGQRVNDSVSKFERSRVHCLSTALRAEALRTWRVATCAEHFSPTPRSKACGLCALVPAGSLTVSCPLASFATSASPGAALAGAVELVAAAVEQREGFGCAIAPAWRRRARPIPTDRGVTEPGGWRTLRARTRGHKSRFAIGGRGAIDAVPVGVRPGRLSPRSRASARSLP